MSGSNYRLPFRPAPSRWFETYTPRHQTVHAIDALSRTGLTQFEGSDEQRNKPLHISKIKQAVREFDILYSKYSRYLPQPDQHPANMIMAPEDEAEQALDRIRGFISQLDQTQELLVEHEHQLKMLHLLSEYFENAQNVPESLTRLSRSSEFLYRKLYACPKSRIDTVGQAAISISVEGDQHDFFAIADAPDKAVVIDNFFIDRGCIAIKVPEWLDGSTAQQHSKIKRAIDELEAATSADDKGMYASRHDKELGSAVSNMALLKWYADKPGIEETSPKLCHITGWATTDEIERLQQALDDHNIDAIIRFSLPPVNIQPPVSILQTWWSKPFHLFVRMMGTPGSAEVDPSFVLPFIVPLLFGYMFPDVGHGLVLVFLGLGFYKHWPAIRFLIPCGIVSSLFGLLFGEVFGIHDIIPALWIHPLEHPIQTLAAPMIFGIFLMLLGLVFNGIESYWRREFKAWVLSDAAIILFYASAVMTFFNLNFIWPLAVSLAWYLLGSLVSPGTGRASAVMKAAGNLILSALELALNTLSFLRVGAFALAHAALTTGILTLTSNIEDNTVRIIMLILLHGLLIIAEGFIVFVQTIRLVLFEFFIRFLHAEGRIFRPSHPSGDTSAS